MTVVQHDGGGGSRSSSNWWQGLDVPSGKQEMKPDQVRALADRLESLLNDLTNNSAGTPEDLYQKSSTVAMNNAFGKWDTGVLMQESFVEAHDGVAECYQTLRSQLNAVIGTLRYEADVFEGIDSATGQGFDQTQTPGYGPDTGYPGGAGSLGGAGYGGGTSIGGTPGMGT